MANQKEGRLMQALIKNPNSMIVEVGFDNGSTDFIPFQCKGIKSAIEGNPETDKVIRAAYSIVYALLGVSQSDAIREMEEEFPECLSCPTFPVILNPLLPPGKNPVAVVGTWSRDALKNSVPNSLSTHGVISLN